MISVVDLSGRKIIEQRVELKEGMTSVEIEGSDELAASVYIVELRTSQESVSSKITIE